MQRQKWEGPSKNRLTCGNISRVPEQPREDVGDGVQRAAPAVKNKQKTWLAVREQTGCMGARNPHSARRKRAAKGAGRRAGYDLCCLPFPLPFPLAAFPLSSTANAARNCAKKVLCSHVCKITLADEPFSSRRCSLMLGCRQCWSLIRTRPINANACSGVKESQGWTATEGDLAAIKLSAARRVLMSHARKKRNATQSLENLHWLAVGT